jgi:hypothetical protein
MRSADAFGSIKYVTAMAVVQLFVQHCQPKAKVRQNAALAGKHELLLTVQQA